MDLLSFLCNAGMVWAWLLPSSVFDPSTSQPNLLVVVIEISQKVCTCAMALASYDPGHLYIPYKADSVIENVLKSKVANYKADSVGSWFTN